MNNKRVLGGALSWGVDTISEVRVDSEKNLFPGVMRFRVVNYTHKYFAIGASSSGRGTVGFKIDSNVAKRGGKEGFTHTQFSGYIAHLFLGYFKIYLYVFPG